jgi:cell division protein FtsL
MAREKAMASAVFYPSMAQAGEWIDQAAATQPRGMFIGTPEIYFSKRIDNSRVAKVTDPKRRREMLTFGITLAMFFLLVMVYLWQHFSAIEYGYKIEQLKVERDTISESNRALSLEEASLKDLPRIDRLARELGMQRPIDGQWLPMETATAVPSVPVMAKANAIMVVSAIQ